MWLGEYPGGYDGDCYYYSHETAGSAATSGAGAASAGASAAPISGQDIPLNPHQPLPPDFR